MPDFQTLNVIVFVLHTSFSRTFGVRGLEDRISLRDVHRSTILKLSLATKRTGEIVGCGISLICKLSC